jgi:hypothetical protein
VELKRFDREEYCGAFMTRLAGAGGQWGCMYLGLVTQFVVGSPCLQ